MWIDQIPTWVLNFCDFLIIFTRPKKLPPIPHLNFPYQIGQISPSRPHPPTESNGKHTTTGRPKPPPRVGQRPSQHSWPRWRHKHCKVGFYGNFEVPKRFVEHWSSWWFWGPKNGTWDPGFYWVVATQTFFIFTPKIGEDEPILTSIFFKGVGSTTNQRCFGDLRLQVIQCHLCHLAGKMYAKNTYCR